MSGSVQRVRTSYAALDRDQRFAAAAAIWLLLAMFLPWYEKTVFVVVDGKLQRGSDAISAFGAVSFVEAAIFLVAAGVIVLLLARADERPFHLPGGDGNVIFLAGLWATLLIFYRVFDRPNISGEGGTVGIQWGFFVAFVAAGMLSFTGQRIRVAGRPEPAQPAAAQDPPSHDPERQRMRSKARSQVRDDVQTVVVARKESAAPPAPRRDRPRRDRKVTRDDARALRFEDPAEEPPLRPGEIPPARDSN